MMYVGALWASDTFPHLDFPLLDWTRISWSAYEWNLESTRRRYVQLASFHSIRIRDTAKIHELSSQGAIQLGQDFCTICILLCNFAVLLGNFKFQTRIWPWISLKPEKRIFFFASYSRFFKYEIRQICDSWNFFRQLCEIYKYEYGL